MVRDFVIEVEREGRKTQVIAVPRDGDFLVRFKQRVPDGGFMLAAIVDGASVDNRQLEEATLTLCISDGSGRPPFAENETTIGWGNEEGRRARRRRRREKARCNECGSTSHGAAYCDAEAGGGGF